MSKNNQNFKNKKFANQKQQKPAVSTSPAASSKPSSKKSSQGSTILPKLERWLPLIYFLLFSLMAFIYLAVLNKDYLYGCQEHSIWQNNREFFDDQMRVVGGFSQWLGCYFTQYFYHPWLGSLILIALWGLIYLLSLKIFPVKKRWSILLLAPCVLLLISEIDMGYWMYYNKNIGYWFSITTAILIMLLGIYICNLYKGYVKAGLVVLYAVGLYPLIGFWCLCGVAYMVVQSLVQRTDGKWDTKDYARYVLVVLGILSIVLVPQYYYSHYTTILPQRIYTVMLPQFQSDRFVEGIKQLPFILIAMFPLLLIALSQFTAIGFKGKKENEQEHGGKWWFAGVAAIAAVYFISVDYFNFDDTNFQAEIRMYKHLEDCDWQGVLDESLKAEGPHTREMIMAQNVALLHQGNIGDNMFKYMNKTVAPYVPTYTKDPDKKLEDMEKYKEQIEQNDFAGNMDRDSLRVNLCNVCGPLLYFMYGKTNFATRWCIENGVEFSFRVDDYKNMIRCAMLTGEDKLAAKYIDILRSTTFHKDWADERLEMLHDKKKYEASEEYKCVKPMYDSFSNALDGDQGLVEMYLITYFCHMHSDNPRFQEATLAFALIQKDIQLFWPRFFKYATLHEKEAMPIHYQEAAYLFGDLEHQVDISKMPFDQERIVKRYGRFKTAITNLMRTYQPQFKDDDDGMTRKVGEECFAQFGDTYWWFYYFSRGVHTY